MYTYTYIYICIHVSVYICIYIIQCVCGCMYVYMYLNRKRQWLPCSRRACVGWHCRLLTGSSHDTAHPAEHARLVRVLRTYTCVYIRSGTTVLGCGGTAEGPRVAVCRAQARTCPSTPEATRARRAPRGSRPRRRAAPRRPPRARILGLSSLSWRPDLTPRGAATTSSITMRTSTRTRSAPATLAHSCCAPHSRPVRRSRADAPTRVYCGARGRRV
jgi:hypothetical protein